MFQRIIRVFKSWIGYFISFAEDPEVMLQESIEEMRNTLPRLNQILVTTRATVLRLEQEKDELQHKEKQLINSIKAALSEGSPESRRIAEDDAATLQQVRQELTATDEQLMAGRNAFQNAQLTVEDIKTKLKARIEQSRKAIQESRKAAVLKSAASALSEARPVRYRRHRRQVPGRDQAARRRGQGLRRSGHRRPRRRPDQDRAQGAPAPGPGHPQRVRGGDGAQEARRRQGSRPIPDRRRHRGSGAEGAGALSPHPPGPPLPSSLPSPGRGGKERSIFGSLDGSSPLPGARA